MQHEAQTWNFVAVARRRKNMAPLSDLSREMAAFAGVQSFQVAYARN